MFSVDGLPADTAVFAEPAACAMHGARDPAGPPRLERAGLRIRPDRAPARPAHRLRRRVVRHRRGARASSSSRRPRRSASTGPCRSTGATPTANLAPLREQSPRGDGFDIVVEATGSTGVGDICVPLTRNGGTVLVYGVTRDEDTRQFHPFDVFRREITIKGSFAEITSFGAAIEALRNGRVRTDGMITHRFGLDDYGKALDALANDPTAHKVVLTA